jgi:hypothetical protein
MANPAVSARTIFSTGEKDDDWEKEKKKMVTFMFQQEELPISSLPSCTWATSILVGTWRALDQVIFMAASPGSFVWSTLALHVWEK